MHRLRRYTPDILAITGMIARAQPLDSYLYGGRDALDHHKALSREHGAHN